MNARVFLFDAEKKKLVSMSVLNLNSGSFESKYNYLMLLFYFSCRHVSAFSLGRIQVTWYIIEETIECES